MHVIIRPAPTGHDRNWSIEYDDYDSKASFKYPDLEFFEDMRWYLEEFAQDSPYETERAGSILSRMRELRDQLTAAVFNKPFLDSRNQTDAAITLAICNDVSFRGSSEEKCSQLPWELIEDSKNHRNVRVIRIATATESIVPSISSSLLSERKIETKASLGSLKILIVVARSLDQTSGDIDSQLIVKPILNCIKAIQPQISNQIEVDFVRPPTLRSLKKKLEQKYDLVHFDVHGVLFPGQACIQLLDCPASAKEIVPALKRSGVRCVLFNACNSADPVSNFATELVLAGIPNVLACSHKLDQHAAASLFTGFYESLILSGNPFYMAASEARARRRQTPLLQDRFGEQIKVHDWHTLVVYTSVHVEEFHFEPKRRGSPLSSTLPLPIEDSDIIRSLPILQIETDLVKDPSRPVVLLTGISGCGKTTTIAQAIDWWKLSRFISDAFRFDCTRTLSLQTIRSTLCHHQDQNEVTLSDLDEDQTLDFTCRAILEVLCSKNFLLVFDSFESCDRRLAQQLVKLAKDYHMQKKPKKTTVGSSFMIFITTPGNLSPRAEHFTVRPPEWALQQWGFPVRPLEDFSLREATSFIHNRGYAPQLLDGKASKEALLSLEIVVMILAKNPSAMSILVPRLYLPNEQFSEAPVRALSGTLFDHGVQGLNGGESRAVFCLNKVITEDVSPLLIYASFVDRIPSNPYTLISLFTILLDMEYIEQLGSVNALWKDCVSLKKKLIPIETPEEAREPDLRVFRTPLRSFDTRAAEEFEGCSILCHIRQELDSWLQCGLLREDMSYTGTNSAWEGPMYVMHPLLAAALRAKANAQASPLEQRLRLGWQELRSNYLRTMFSQWLLPNRLDGPEFLSREMLNVSAVVISQIVDARLRHTVPDIEPSHFSYLRAMHVHFDLASPCGRLICLIMDLIIDLYHEYEQRTGVRAHMEDWKFQIHCISESDHVAIIPVEGIVDMLTIENQSKWRKQAIRAAFERALDCGRDWKQIARYDQFLLEQTCEHDKSPHSARKIAEARSAALSLRFLEAVQILKDNETYLLEDSNGKLLSENVIDLHYTQTLLLQCLKCSRAPPEDQTRIEEKIRETQAMLPTQSWRPPGDLERVKGTQLDQDLWFDSLAQVQKFVQGGTDMKTPLATLTDYTHRLQTQRSNEHTELLQCHAQLAILFIHRHQPLDAERHLNTAFKIQDALEPSRMGNDASRDEDQKRGEWEMKPFLHFLRGYNHGFNIGYNPDVDSTEEIFRSMLDCISIIEDRRAKTKVPLSWQASFLQFLPSIMLLSRDITGLDRHRQFPGDRERAELMINALHAMYEPSLVARRLQTSEAKTQWDSGAFPAIDAFLSVKEASINSALDDRDNKKGLWYGHLTMAFLSPLIEVPIMAHEIRSRNMFAGLWDLSKATFSLENMGSKRVPVPSSERCTSWEERCLEEIYDRHESWRSLFSEPQAGVPEAEGVGSWESSHVCKRFMREAEWIMFGNATWLAAKRESKEFLIFEDSALTIHGLTSRDN